MPSFKTLAFSNIFYSVCRRRPEQELEGPLDGKPKSFPSRFALALKQHEKEILTSSSSRRFGNVEKQESSFVRLCLGGKLTRKRELGGGVPGG